MWPFHTHNWDVYEAQKCTVGFWFDKEPTNPRTYFKRRCTKCGKLERDYVAGWWSLDELRGEAFDG